MDLSEETVILTFGSEKIMIEKNDMCSDDSEMSDSSSCLSYSGYEEIEVGPSLNVEEQRSIRPNPYVKLVRCDHLVEVVFPAPNLKRTENKSIRSSPRMRRKNDACVCDEFDFYETLNKKKGRRNSYVRKTKHSVKCVNNFCFEQDDKEISNLSTALAKNIKQDYLNDDSFEYNVNGFTSNPYHFSRNSSEELSFSDLKEGSPLSALKELLPISTINEKTAISAIEETMSISAIKEELSAFDIKEEPRDEYFDSMSGGNLDSKFTSKNQTIDPGKSHQIQINKFIKQEADSSTMSFESDKLDFTNVVINGDLSDIKTYTIIQQENTTESSDSEVDVEKNWDASFFTAVQTNVAFDHPYANQHESAYPIGLVKATINNTPKSTPIIDSKTIPDTTLRQKEKTPKTENEDQEPRVGRSEKSRTKHNINEKNNRTLMRERFATLRDEIPQLYALDRTSKVTILEKAVLCIKSLEYKGKFLVQNLNNLKEKHKELTKRLKRARNHQK